MVSWQSTASTAFTALIVAFTFILIGLDRAGIAPILRAITTTLYLWTLLLAGFALLLGVVNVLWVHLRRLQDGQPEWPQSLALVASCLAVFVAGILYPSGVTHPTVEWVFDHLIAPGQATLYALIFFFMAVAAYRYLRFAHPGGGWMLAGALLMLVAQMPASSNLLPPEFASVVAWLLQAPVMAILRGALLGSSLALAIVGIRFLLGRTKP